MKLVAVSMVVAFAVTGLIIIGLAAGYLWRKSWQKTV